MEAPAGITQEKVHTEFLHLPSAVIALLGHISTVDPMLLPSGNPFKCHEEVLSSLQPMIPPT